MYCFINKVLYMGEMYFSETNVKFIYTIYFPDLIGNLDVGSLGVFQKSLVGTESGLRRH